MQDIKDANTYVAGTPGFEVGTKTKAFYADGTPVPDSRNDGQPMEWYDGRFWFGVEDEAQEMADQYNADRDNKRVHEDGTYTVTEWVVVKGVELFGGLASTETYGF